KPIATALHFKAHELYELRSGTARSDDRFFHSEAIHTLQRKIKSAFAVIHGHILPEIGELQPRASVVGELLALGVAVSADVKHQVPDGISRIPAVTAQIVESCIASNGLILAEGNQQICEWLFGN